MPGNDENVHNLFLKDIDYMLNLLSNLPQQLSLYIHEILQTNNRITDESEIEFILEKCIAIVR